MGDITDRCHAFQTVIFQDRKSHQFQLLHPIPCLFDRDILPDTFHFMQRDIAHPGPDIAQKLRGLHLKLL